MAFEIRQYQEPDVSAVVSLWQKCDVVIPPDDPHEVIQAKIAFQPELFLIAQFDWQLIGTIMAGYDGHRGSLKYLVIDPEHRRDGFAQLLIEAAEHRLIELGCRKVNIQVHGYNKRIIDYYRSVGYVTEDIVNMGKHMPKTIEEDHDDPPLKRVI